MKILIVDDLETTRRPLAGYLTSAGYETVEAGDGLSALKIARNQPLDLVITDIRMSPMDGLELLHRLKSIKADLDVMIMTGFADLDSSLEALRQGASNYLMKPINMDELLLAVQAVEKRRLLALKLREQEARLLQARKMAELGLVVSGVAHEINNPNTYVRGNAQTLVKFWKVLEPFLQSAIKAGLPAPTKLEYIMKEAPRILDAILTGTERIKTIVEATAAFAGADGDEYTVTVDLNDCVRQACLGKGGEAAFVSQKLADGLPRVMATEEELVEVITELLNNSLTAIRDREQPFIEIRTIRPAEDEVVLQVEDNGLGIKAEDQGRVFTPFFTTSPRIGRPGLGLPKAYALVHNFGGEIYFTSQEGVGTLFTVQLLPKA